VRSWQSWQRWNASTLPVARTSSPDLALFAVGAAIGLLNGPGAVRSSARQHKQVGCRVTATCNASRWAPGHTGAVDSRVQPLRCVIVDDNPAFLDAAASFIGRDRITVVGVPSTSAEALRRVAQLRPDVTVVDIDLGGESGFNLAEQLAGGPVSSPVILTSTHSEQEFANMIAASPALGFVPKVALSPEAIRRLLDG